MFEIVDWNFVIKIIKKIFEINDALFTLQPNTNYVL
jgi:hypothetical protein